MFRERLAQLITRDGTFVVSGEADNIQSALQIIETHLPDIAIIDITLNGSSGLELLKELKARNINVPVLVLSMHAEALYAERVIRAGGRGYITKHEASSTLLKAIRHVVDGNVYLSEEMNAAIPAEKSGQDTDGAAGSLGLLADRELEVFQLLGKGFNAREIAAQLHLGETTVHTYRMRIKEKLRLRNAAELCSRAAQWVQEQGL